MGQFTTPTLLPTTRAVTTQDLYNVLENLRPASGLVDENTVTIVSNKLATGTVVPRWEQVAGPSATTWSYSDFSSATTSDAETALTLSAGQLIHAVIIAVTTAFDGTGTKLQIGISGTPAKYGEMDPVTSPGADLTTTVGLESMSTPTQLLATLVVGSGTIDGLTQGAFNLYVLTSNVLGA